jgi:hypothetical protein
MFRRKQRDDPLDPPRAREPPLYRPAQSRTPAHCRDLPSRGARARRPRRARAARHGAQRDEYRDFWIPAADKHRLLVVATSFSDAAWPKAESYNNGLVFAEDGAVRPRAAWAYASIERVFDAVRESGATNRAKALLFGHSAGSQFGHRLVLTSAPGFVETALCGNAGWYTLPTLEKPFPAGLGGLGLTEADLARALRFPLVVLAGTADNDPAAQNLPDHAEAKAQGDSRYARAHFFFRFAEDEARRLGLDFAWRIHDVPGVGHDGKTMSAAAAALWFEGAIPADIAAGASGKGAA